MALMKTHPPLHAQVAKARAEPRRSATVLPCAHPQRFKSGITNPGVQRSKFLAARKARVAATSRKRIAAALAKYNPDGIKLTSAGKRSPMSSRERALVVHHVRKLGRTQLEAGAAAGVSQPAVSRFLKTIRSDMGSGDDADAELSETALGAVKGHSGGRPSQLTPAIEASLKQAVKVDPFGGIAEVYKALQQHGLQVSQRTLYRWLQQVDVHARATSIYAELNERLIHGILNHVEAVRDALARGKITFENLAYADQTPIFICTGHSSAHGVGVVFGDGGDAKGGKKVGNLWAVITVRCCLRAWVTDLSGDEESTKQFFLSNTPPPEWKVIHGDDGNIFDLLAAHGRQLSGRCRKMILCVDRLGKSGASEYSVSGHHTPELRVRAASARVGLLMLCPKGALVNPIEPWNLHVKREMSSQQPTGAPTDDWGQLIRGPRTKAEALVMLSIAISKIDRKPAQLRWCYHMRCTGGDAILRLEDNAVYQAVCAARAAQPVAPFDVLEAAFAPRARMSTQHAYPVSKCRMETYNVYFWRHYWLELHAGLPMPFVRPLDADGYEKHCRLCSPVSKGAKARDTLLVCCGSCPGVFHYECLGLDAPPKGDWSCAACMRGDLGQLRKWQDPNPNPKTKKNQPKKKRAPGSDGDPAGSDDE